VLKRLMQGAAAGAAGATALNAATYLDMVLRARPSSSSPEQIVEELSRRTGVEIPGSAEDRPNRLQGLGALSGLAVAVLVGVLAGELRFAVLRLGPVLGTVLLGGTAMAATDVSMARLGVSDPSGWDAASWASDAVPHLAFGAVAYGTLAAMSRWG
jgi:hypothetical protein